MNEQERHALTFKANLVTAQKRMDWIRRKISEPDCDPCVAGWSVLALEVLAVREAHCKRCIEYHSLPDTEENKPKHDELLVEIKRWEFEEKASWQAIQRDMKALWPQSSNGKQVAERGAELSEPGIPWEGSAMSLGEFAEELYGQGKLPKFIKSKAAAIKLLCSLYLVDGKHPNPETIRLNLATAKNRAN
jgi:hypothetical protein